MHREPPLMDELARAAEAAARFSGEKPGNIYSRFTNPTVRVFEERLAAVHLLAGGVDEQLLQPAREARVHMRDAPLVGDHRRHRAQRLVTGRRPTAPAGCVR